MSGSVGRALAARGVASLAIDLPLHGERAGSPEGFPRNPLAIARVWRRTNADVRAAIDWMSTRPSVNDRQLGIVGYSLGGFLALHLAAGDLRFKAVVAAAAGDLPDGLPFASVITTMVNPLRAASALAGRPLLLVNGTRDRTTRPAQAERLFAAAGEPKELRWYDGGHWPPPAAIDGAAEWLASRLVS